jgi:hypothetical protein
MAKQSIAAAEKIFEHAECFYQASAVLHTHDPVGPHPDNHKRTHAALTLIEPRIVIEAFTTELFLKCLICIETGSVPREHNLKKLFDLLSKATRTRIESWWDSEVATRRREEWDELEKFGLKIPRDLPKALDKGTDAFKLYRYSYEENTEGLHYYLEDLPALLERLILEMRPDFKNYRRAPLPLQEASYH